MNDMPEVERQIGVQSLETGLVVLGALLSSPDPMRITDIAHVAEMTPAKAHRYLVSYVKLGYVEQERSGLYRLGPGALRLGMHCLAQLDPGRISVSFVDDLSVTLDETVFAAVWTPDGPIIVNWRGPWRPLGVNIRIGTVLPLLYSAVGRVFLAFGPEHETRALRAQEERRGPPQASKSKNPLGAKDISSLTSQIRACGYATVAGDYYDGVNSVGAPVFDHSGRLVMALAAVGVSSTFTGERWDRAVADVQTVAKDISTALGAVVDDQS